MHGRIAVCVRPGVCCGQLARPVRISDGIADHDQFGSIDDTQLDFGQRLGMYRERWRDGRRLGSDGAGNQWQCRDH